MAGLCVPLPTLRCRPCGRPRTAQGRCGSLLLHRVGLHRLLLAGLSGALRNIPYVIPLHRRDHLNPDNYSRISMARSNRLRSKAQIDERDHSLQISHIRLQGAAGPYDAPTGDMPTFPLQPRPASSLLLDDLPIFIIDEFEALRQVVPHRDYAGHSGNTVGRMISTNKQ